MKMKAKNMRRLEADFKERESSTSLRTTSFGREDRRRKAEVQLKTSVNFKENSLRQENVVK